MAKPVNTCQRLICLICGEPKASIMTKCTGLLCRLKEERGMGKKLESKGVELVSPGEKLS